MSETSAVPPEVAQRWRVGLVVACLVLLALWNLGGSPLLDPDEGRYTEVPREMLASGDLVTPHLDGVLYFEKPPLHYWLVAGAQRLLGVNPFAARIWSALAALAGVALAYALGSAMGGRRAGAVAAVVLGTSPLWVAIGRLATLDMTLTFFLTATLACFWLAHREDDRRRARLAWHGAFLAAALAVLTKGLIGIVIPGAVVFLFLLATRQWRVLRRVPWLTAVPLFLAVAVPWHLLVAARNPDFAWFYFVHEHVLRYATPVAERGEPFWYFVAIVLAGCVPWSGLFPSAFRLVGWRRLRESAAQHPEPTFLLIWAVLVIAFFSVSQSKLIPYVLPALPPLAVLVGLLVERLRSGELPESRLEDWGLAAGSVLAALWGTGFVWAGLGKVDRLGLGGVTTPALLAPGVLVVVLALLAGIGAFGRNRPRSLVTPFAAACCLCAAIQALVPLVGRERSAEVAASRLRPLLREGDLVFAYRCYPESLPVYLKRTVGVAAYEGELTFGISHLGAAERKARFPNAADFRALWDSGRRVYAVADRNWARELTADGITHARLLWEGDALALLSNERPSR